MSSVFKPLCTTLSKNPIPHLFLARGLRILSIPRSAIPPSQFQTKSFSSFSQKIIETLSALKELSHQDTPRGRTTRKILEAITGMKQLNAEETEQAIIDHQKLWVAHASINNHSQAHAHYEMFYSMQLFSEPKDFGTQQYYLKLVEKNIGDLSVKELEEVIDLYRFAITQGNNFALQRKLQVYQSALSEKEK